MREKDLEGTLSDLRHQVEAYRHTDRDNTLFDEIGRGLGELNKLAEKTTDPAMKATIKRNKSLFVKSAGGKGKLTSRERRELKRAAGELNNVGKFVKRGRGGR